MIANDQATKMTTAAPVVELAFSVQFPKIANVTALDIAAWAELVRDRYPVLQQVGRLPLIDPKMPGMAQPQEIQFSMSGIELPRMWLVSSDSRRVLQFQDDRFGFNWRKPNPFDQSEVYPSYAALKQEFVALYYEFSDWCEKRFHISLKPTAGDLTYINIVPLVTEDGRRRISDVLAFYSPPVPRLVFGFQTTWMEQFEGTPPGYISMTAAAGALATGEAAIVLNLISRIDLIGAAPDALAWFDNAHEHTLDLFKRVIKSEVWSDLK